MNKQKLAILIIAGIGAVCTFLPWMNMPIVGSVNGTKGDGWITFVLFLIPILLCLFGEKKTQLKNSALIASCATSLLAAGIGVYTMINVNNKLSEIDSTNPFAEALKSSVSIEIGLYLLVITGIAIPLSIFLTKKS